MINAHQRFGHLIYTRVTRKTTTQFRVPLDRLIADEEDAGMAKAHLISVVGGDTQIAALHAAISSGDSFTVETADRTRFCASLGKNAECYRGSLKQPCFERPLRQLVAVSAEMTSMGAAGSSGKTILLDDSAGFLWSSLVEIYGLPGAGDWAVWIAGELKRKGKIRYLTAIGCNPVVIDVDKAGLLKLIRRGLVERRIGFPEKNGPLDWPHVAVSELLAGRAT